MAYQQTWQMWRNNPLLSDAERAELDAAAADPEELEDRFYRRLSFGTAGLRGVMGMGTNRMNLFTVRQATRALAQVLLQRKGPEASVCLCFDCRRNSRAFAREAARVLHHYGITVHIFTDPRPTPQLSFAVRRLGTSAGINITASHNPEAYNGFKVYWDDGAQIGGDIAGAVEQCMDGIDVLSDIPGTFEQGVAAGGIRFIDPTLDQQYIDAVLACSVLPAAAQAHKAALRIVYTPFHGVGGAIMPQVFAQRGFSSVCCVEEQMAPDGSFPTLQSPNPEYPAGFALAAALGRQVEADVLIGTDPDADRVAIHARDAQGKFIPVTGNQTGALLTHYLIEARRQAGTLPHNAALVQTIVTGGLSKAVAAAAGVHCAETFTGFKYMAEQVRQFEEDGSYRYLMAWEESIGYMVGDHARDKDGICGAMLLAEMAAWYRSRGMTLLDGLQELWDRHGCYAEQTVSILLPGADGSEKMRYIMAFLRQTPPTVIGGKAVIAVRDYLTGTQRTLPKGEASAVALRGSDVLYFTLEDDARFIVRPSGTEPKIKVYVLAKSDTLQQAEALAQAYAQQANTVLGL